MLGELTKSIVITISGFGVVDATSAAECEESVCGACATRYGVLSARDVQRCTQRVGIYSVQYGMARDVQRVARDVHRG